MDDEMRRDERMMAMMAVGVKSVIFVKNKVVMVGYDNNSGHYT